jgi:hypothetical protein
MLTFAFTPQGNILTGLVNLSINTLAVGDAAKLAILTVYMSVILFAVKWFHAHNISVKL